MLSRSFISWVSLCCIFGCFVAYSVAVSPFPLSVAIVLISVALILVRHDGRKVLVCACAVALLLGMLRVAHSRQPVALTENLYQGSASFHGIISGDVTVSGGRNRYVVQVSRMHTPDGDPIPFPDGGSVLVIEPFPTSCVSGEEAAFRGRLREPQDFISPSGRVFRYRDYLRQSSVYLTAFVRESSCVGHATHPSVFSSLRATLVRVMHQLLPVSEASLLGGLLLGIRGSLPADLMEAFRITGLVHIIVLSGYNITLVADSVRKLLARTPRSFSFLASCLVILSFVLLAGAQTAAIRAGSMATVSLVARALRREYDGIRALLLVAVAMILWNPDQVLHSVSFHLSFLATLGLLVFATPLERRLSFLPDRLQIRSVVAATLATQLILLPYLAHSIGEVSVVGILANAVILPLIPIAMAAGAAVTVIGMISPLVASILVPVAYVPLHGVIVLAEGFARVPYSTLLLPEAPAFLMLFATGLLVWVGFRLSSRESDSA